MMRVFFEVDGIPAPQGSKRHVGGGRMIEQSKRVGPWRAAVKRAAELEAEKLDGPLSSVHGLGYETHFFFPKPKKSRYAAPIGHQIGDVDKLQRAVFDALTQSGLIVDDAHFVTGRASKQWADEDGPGVVIVVWEVEP